MMVRYRTREGVVLVKICGTRLLVPNRKASETCHQIQKLTFFSGAVWSMLEKGKSVDDVYEMYHVFTKKSESEVHKTVDQIIDNFVQKGFLVKEEIPEV